jgi:hypothetical protein
VVVAESTFVRDVRAAILPARLDGYEVGRRRELHVDPELVLQLLDSPQKRVRLGDEEDVDVDRRLPPAEENRGRSTREVTRAVRAGRLAESAHESTNAVGVD